ncbi:MAG: anthranilate synthase component I family protein [Planctomycetes bacterium]|nr:anthranilate synthase component I family protein [Planctomycetota bacterium]
MTATLRLQTHALGAVPDAGALLAQLHALNPVLFDSGAGGRFGRTSMLAFSQRRVFTWQQGDVGDPLAALESELARAPRMDPSDGPFPGGWVALLSYETRHLVERLPSRHARITNLPDALLLEVRVVLVRDEVSGQGTLLVCEAPHDAAETQQTRELAASVLRLLATPPPRVLWSPPRGALIPPNAAAHHVRVAAAREHILAGDIYQANLAQAWRMPRPADTVACYRHLRTLNPPTFGGYLEAQGEALLCFSPERFLRVDGDIVTTRPIKGTAPRGRTQHEDQAAATALQHSVKDRAELAMIVDILRNDLSRVCRVGSVEVLSAMELEQHATVHHLVAEIRGRLLPGESVATLLRATLPGGSITGAPRIRAMEIIDALEAQQRGPYCGTLGWIGYDGRSDWNIIIRSAFTAGDSMILHGGGGIVLDSDPQREEEETRHKLAALLSAWQ